MITITNKSLFRAYTISTFIFLFSLLCVAWFEDVFSGILFLIIGPILTIIISIYFVRKKLIKENNKILLILPAIGFIVALILSIIVQIYLVNIDPYHAGQVSMDMVWPFFSVAYIIGVFFVNIILASILLYQLNRDMVEFKDTIQYSFYKSLLFFIICLFVFGFILYTPYIKDPELKNREAESQMKAEIHNTVFELRNRGEDVISYCERLNNSTMRDYCFEE